jgi:5'(3')-deoxyribonucleotidase
MTRHPRILCDLDCVLADFVRGAAGLWNLTVKQLLEVQSPGVYGLNQPIASALARQEGNPGWRDVMPLTAREFWQPINDTPGFWSNLEPLPWAKELFRYLFEASGGDLWEVTSPSECRDVVREKKDWCKAHLDFPRDRVIPTQHKQLMAYTKAGPAVLVDDWDENCKAFEEQGGEAILFPAHHNPRYNYRADPAAVVRQHLERLRTR